MNSKNRSKIIETNLDVGGCHLHYKIWQGSDLVLVLEVGGGADSSMWGALPSTLAKETDATVVIYDRAGFGKSDLPSSPYDLVQETHWLMSGLQQLELSDNIILVGHSYGGWLIQLIACLYPEIVRGLILVDPFTTEFVEMLGVDYLDHHPMATKDPPFASSNHEPLTKNQRGLIRMVKDGLGEKLEVMRHMKIPEGLPVRIITSGEPWWLKPKEDEAWQKAQEKLAARIPGAVLQVAEGCDHFIQEKKPGMIIDAVREVIQLVHEDI